MSPTNHPGTRRLYFAILFTLSLTVTPAREQWLRPPTPANQVSVSIAPTVTFDPASGLYSYDYVVVSRPASLQNVSSFALRLISAGTQGSSPSGWTFGDYDAEPIVSWDATEAAARPPGWVDDGSIPPAAKSIRPGTSLSGFRFVSRDPPGDVTFYAQGETQLPLLAPGADADALPPWDHHITVDSVSGTTIGPVPIIPPKTFSKAAAGRPSMVSWCS